MCSVDAVLGGGLLHVVEDRGAVGDRLRLAPGLEAVAERVHVAVGADARIAEEVPGAAHRRAPFEDAGSSCPGTARCRWTAAPTPDRPAPTMITSECMTAKLLPDRLLQSRVGLRTFSLLAGQEQISYERRAPTYHAGFAACAPKSGEKLTSRNNLLAIQRNVCPWKSGSDRRPVSY